MTNEKAAKAAIPKSVLVANKKAANEALGLVRRPYWATPEQHEKIKQFIAGLKT
jgi:hypothetical protein